MNRREMSNRHSLPILIANAGILRFRRIIEEKQEAAHPLGGASRPSVCYKFL